LIKGPYCFVFKDENAPAPKYAISLAHMVPRESSKGQVALETSLGDQEYIVTFDDGQVAPEFVSVVKKQASVGEQETVRKRLGHGSLMKKGVSTRLAEKIAQKKMADQPEKSLGANDVVNDISRMGY